MEHNHPHHTPQSPEETLALLHYMLDHNRHHSEELHDLAHHTPSQAAELIHQAVKELDRGNDLLEKALKLLEGAE